MPVRLAYNTFMEDQIKSKVVVDTKIAETIPTVVISSPLTPNKSKPQIIKPGFIQIMTKRVVNFFLDFMETIVVALSIFVVFYLFLAQPHEIKGSSMEPTFQNNEYVLTDKISYRFRDPNRGDVIVFKAPRNPDVDFIKRIIALPGEKVKIENGHVLINENLLSEPYLTSLTTLYPGSFIEEGTEIVVPDREFFVMGDNRAHSSDSREFGTVKRNLIIGRAFIRYWPINKFGVVSNVGNY